MKSRTSFSRITVFKKNITRYAPIWAIYLIGLMLVFVDNSYHSHADRFAAHVMDELVASFGIVNMIYAGVIAVMVYGDLYNTRMCYSLHTIPLRREGILLSNLVSGFLFSLVPNVIASLYLMTQLQEFSVLALWWLLASALQFLFFYGLATVSALLTGNRFAMLAVYAGFNFVAMLAYWLVNTIYLPELPGVVADITAYSRFSPVVHLVDNFEFFKFEEYQVLVTIPDSLYDDYYETHYKYLGLGNGWGYHAILGGLGLALMGLSVILYRLRHLECAGDFVAFPKTKGAACVIITLCVMLVLALLGDSFGEGYILWLIVGLVVGYFGSLMLLERRVKVFYKKNFLGFVALAVAVALSFTAVIFDWFGIADWTPDPEKVESVTVANYRSNNYNGGYYDNRIKVTLTEPEEIADIVEAHKDIIPRLGEKDANDEFKPTHYVCIIYKMTSGRTVMRAYNAPADGKNYEIVSKYFYKPEQILGYSDPVQAANSVNYVYASSGEVSKEMYEELFRALQIDCEKGYVKTNGKYESKMYVEYYINAGKESVSRNLVILPGATNTLALLNSPEQILGYKEWDKFLYLLEFVMVDGEEIDRSHYEGLLNAIRTDIEQGYITAEPWAGWDYEIAISTGQDYRDIYVTAEAVNTVAYLKNNDVYQKTPAL